MKEKLMNLKITKQGKIVLSVVIAIFMLIFIITILYSNKFYPNTTVGGIDVSGMTLTEAREAVETDLKNHVLVIKGRNNAKYELKGKDSKEPKDSKWNNPLKSDSKQVKTDKKAKKKEEADSAPEVIEVTDVEIVEKPKDDDAALH